MTKESYTDLQVDKYKLVSRYCNFGNNSLSLFFTLESPRSLSILDATDVRFRPKMGQISPKLDKSGKYSDQIQYVLAL